MPKNIKQPAYKNKAVKSGARSGEQPTYMKKANESAPKPGKQSVYRSSGTAKY